jgi:RHS repeat-associated protein
VLMSAKWFRCIIFLIFPLAFLLSFSEAASAYSVQNEAESAILSGGAVVSSCSTCSGSSKVGYVGNNQGTIQFTMNVPSTGSYFLDVFYATNGNRDAYISVNNNPGVLVHFNSTGSFTTIGVQKVPVQLNVGTNNIKIYNNFAWAPDFDKFVLSDVDYTEIYADLLLDKWYSGANSNYSDFYGSLDNDPSKPPVYVSPDIILGSDTSNTLSLPTGSYVTVGFSKQIVDAPGRPDIFVQENSPAGDQAKVYVSHDNNNFVFLGIAQTGVITAFDLESIGFKESVVAVAVVGLDNNGTWPGFDLVNVKGVSNNQPSMIPSNLGINPISGNQAVDEIRKIDPFQIDPLSFHADPIDTSTGAQIIHRSLMTLYGARSLSFEIDYNSLLLNQGPMGIGWEHGFEARLEETVTQSVYIHWSNNRMNSFIPGTNGEYSSTEFASRRDQLVKHEDGTFSLTRYDGQVYEFDTSGKLIKQKDKNGKTFNLTYNATTGRLEKITEPLTAQSLSLTYDSSARISKVTDNLQRNVQFIYDSSSRLVKIIDALGQEITYTYDEMGHVLTGSEQGEQKFSNTYDQRGRIIVQDDSISSNSLTKFRYDEISEPGKLITTVTDRVGNSKKLTHDNNYRLLQVENELGNTTVYTYDDFGNQTSVIDANGNTTTMTYDERGNKLSVTDAVYGTTRMTYDNRNNVLTVTNAVYKQIVNTYDSNNNLTSVTDAEGNSTSYTYDVNGLLTSQTTPDGNVTTYNYTNGKMTSSSDPEGNITIYAYDAVGRLIKITDPLGQITQKAYDANDRVISLTDPLGGVTKFTYNFHGDLLTKNDAIGNKTTFEYNGNGKLVKSIDSPGNITRYEYDGEDRLIHVIDPLLNAVTKSYDAVGNLRTVTSAVYNNITYRDDLITDIYINISTEGCCDYFYAEAFYNNTWNVVFTGSGSQAKWVTLPQPASQLRTRLQTDGSVQSGWGGDVPKIKVQSTGSPVDTQNLKILWVSNNQNTYSTPWTPPQAVQITEGAPSITYEYDKLNRKTKEIDSLGAETAYTYDAVGNLLAVTDANHNTTSYEYDLIGRKISQTDAIGATRSYKYDAMNQIRSMTDASGNITQYTYNKNGKLLSVTDAVYGTTQFEYDPNSRLIKTIDSLGNVTTNNYDAKGRLVKTTEADGGITQMSYDALDRLTSRTDAEGNVEYFEYDAIGRLIRHIDGAGKVTRMGYDANNRLIYTIDPLLNVSTKSYDPAGNLKTVTKAVYNGVTFSDDLITDIYISHETETNYDYFYVEAYYNNTWNVVYSGSGIQAKWITLPQRASQLRTRLKTDSSVQRGWGGDVPQIKVQSTGYVVNTQNLKIDWENNNQDTYSNPWTPPKAIQIIPGAPSLSYEYNKDGKLQSVTDAVNNTTRYEYDALDRLVKVIDPLGNATTNSYDALGRLVKTTDALGNSNQMVYDAVGNLIRKIDAKGNITFMATYDATHNQISASDALNHTTSKQYDAGNRLTQITDPLRRTTKNNYNGLNQLVSVLDAMAGESKQSFDAVGNLTIFTDSNGNTTNYTYNKNGRMLSETSAAGGTIGYEYDSRGLLALKNNARGMKTNYVYDDAGKLTGFTDSAGSVSYTYDENGNNLTVTESAYGSKTRVYDALNRVIQYTDERGNTLHYAYDAVGNLSQLTYPDGKKVTYTYDAVGRMTSVTDWAGRSTGYVYDENGHLIATTRPDGSVETRSYNIDGQLLEIKDIARDGTILVQDGYSYDATGNVTVERDKTYQYDNNNRLIIAGDVRYSYDNAGNITSETVTEATYKSMTYTADNRLATYNGQEVTYDADGNMTFGPLNGQMQSFEYDARNRLVRAGDVSYTYDAENIRTSMTVTGATYGTVTGATYGTVTGTVYGTGTGTTFYMVNPLANLSQILMETDEQGHAKAYYVYGLGLIGREDAAGNYSIYHFDRRGSTTVLTNVYGNVTDRYTYGVYGELLVQEGATPNPFLYNGRDGVMTDPNGLYYMRARYYNPDIKRFINRDVVTGNIANGQTLNRFAYVNGNPISYVDPFGLSRDGDSNVFSVTGHFLFGVGKGAFNMVKGIADVVQHPIETIDGISYTINHPVSAGQAIWSNIKGNFYQNVINGSGNSQAEYTGEAIFNIATMFVGVGEVNAASKSAALIEETSTAAKLAESAGKFRHKLDLQMFASEVSGKIDKAYSRPSGYRKGVKDDVWEKAKGADGEVRDPVSEQIMKKDESWDMGHKPGFEFRKHQQSAQERGISRKEFLDEHNNPDHYQPELPSSNRSHKGEDLTDDYFGD